MKRQVFKSYQQKQRMLLPPSLEEMIPEGHLVRVVDEMIEGIELSVLEEQYKGGGTSAYHPKMMLKVLIYAYTQRTFSSRRIAKEVREYQLYVAERDEPARSSNDQPISRGDHERGDRRSVLWGDRKVDRNGVCQS